MSPPPDEADKPKTENGLSNGETIIKEETIKSEQCFNPLPMETLKSEVMLSGAVDNTSTSTLAGVIPLKAEAPSTSEIKSSVSETTKGVNGASQQNQEGSDDEEDLVNDAEREAEKKKQEDDDFKLLHSDPSFSSICSFFNKFGSLLNIKPYSFSKMESMLAVVEKDGSINNDLIDLHVILLRKLRYVAARADKLELFLMKFCANIPILDSEYLQLERFGYAHLPLTSKIAILKSLCEAQFDLNPKLKETMLAASKASDLRLVPCGIDKGGLAYWYMQDHEYDVRLYTEEQDDQSGNTWTLAAKSASELDTLIDNLKKEDLGYKKREIVRDKNGKPLGPKMAVMVDDNGKIVLSSKLGTYLDTHQSDLDWKQKRETKEKEKLEKKEKKLKKKPVAESESEKEEEVADDEPDMGHSDRRILPRRTARVSAVATLHKMATPTRKNEKKKKDKQEDEDEETKDVEKEDAQSSTGGSDEEENEDEQEYDTDDASSGDDDDEFKPKSELKKGKKRRRRRANKTKKRKLEDEEDEEDSDGEQEEVKERRMATQETLCLGCKKSDRWDVLLLCDICDDAWHTDCLHPPLWFVPDDDWFCPKCVHGMLIERLELVKAQLAENLEKKKADQAKKQAMADRFKREMDRIGNISQVFQKSKIPVKPASDSDTTESEQSEEEENTRRRKSKKKAIRRIAPKSRFQREVLQTIAEGRTKRTRATNVDYNFKEYDDLIKEAVEIEEGGPKNKIDPHPHRPQGGAGRGKDMANIIEAEQKRRASIDETVDGSGSEVPAEKKRESNVGRPALGRKIRRKSKKLNDLGSDQSESEDSEFRASEAEEEEEAAASAASESDYLPSDEGRRRTRGGGRWARTRSDDEFVVSGSEDSDASYRGRGRKEVKKQSRGRFGGGSRGKRRAGSFSEESEESNYSDDSTKKPKKKKGRYSDSDESEVEKTKTGRPLRRAVVKTTKKKAVISSDESEGKSEKSEGEEESREPLSVHGNAGSRKRKTKGSDDEPEFEPPSEDAEEADEEEDEEMEESEKSEMDEEERSDNETAEGPNTLSSKKLDDVDDNTRRAPPPKVGLNRAASTPKKLSKTPPTPLLKVKEDAEGRINETSNLTSVVHEQPNSTDTHADRKPTITVTSSTPTPSVTPPTKPTTPVPASAPVSVAPRSAFVEKKPERLAENKPLLADMTPMQPVVGVAPPQRPPPTSVANPYGQAPPNPYAPPPGPYPPYSRAMPVNPYGAYRGPPPGHPMYGQGYGVPPINRVPHIIPHMPPHMGMVSHMAPPRMTPEMYRQSGTPPTSIPYTPVTTISYVPSSSAPYAPTSINYTPPTSGFAPPTTTNDGSLGNALASAMDDNY